MWDRSVFISQFDCVSLLLYHPSLFVSPTSLVNSQTMSNQRTL